MEMHGTVEANLTAAINSSRRLKGRPVHADTLNHWTAVLSEAQRELAADEAGTNLRDLILELEQELVNQASA
jgi:hypothetical protein